VPSCLGTLLCEGKALESQLRTPHPPRDERRDDGDKDKRKRYCQTRLIEQSRECAREQEETRRQSKRCRDDRSEARTGPAGPHVQSSCDSSAGEQRLNAGGV